MAYNILIVDDSPAMRRVVKRVLDLSGVDVGKLLEAAGGRDALGLLRTEWVDLIMTDINMPEMDGEELLLEVRHDPMLASIPVLVVSTDSSELRVKQMMAHGADGYVSKPFTPACLSCEINRLLGGTPHAAI
jgi:two-component system chemotaxis response regulator CheY